MANSCPTSPNSSETQKFSFSGSKDVPIRSVVVYTKDKAEITRVLNFDSATTLGLHEVEVRDLPRISAIEEQSVAVKGSGHCTIRDVSLADASAEESTDPASAEEKSANNAELERIEKELEILRHEHAVLVQEMTRAQQMRHVADRVVERVMLSLPTSGGVGQDTGTPRQVGSIDMDNVTKAVEWWAGKAEQTDKELHHVGRQGVRVIESINKLVLKSNKIKQSETLKESKPKSKILIGLDVEKLGPINLEVKYMMKGAMWQPAYDLRFDSLTDSMSCTYYGLVSQSTEEDWEGVSLSLSTAEPTVREAPPTLGIQTLSLKPKKPTVIQNASPFFSKPFDRPQGNSGMGLPFAPLPASGVFGPVSGGFTCGSPQRGSQQEATASGGFQFGAQDAAPPQPTIEPAVCEVEGGGGGICVVSYTVAQRVTVKSNGQTKKLVIGVLKLSTAITHRLMPSKNPSAYLLAEATNNTDYQLLESKNVSIFVDSNFVAKTSMNSVSPGESFQTCLGYDPAIKVKYVSFRRTKKTSFVFDRTVTIYGHSTSISNNKKVPVTCVLIDALPRAAEDTIKVSLEQPNSSRYRWPRSSSAVTDDALVSEALHLFGREDDEDDEGDKGKSPEGEGKGDAVGDETSSTSPTRKRDRKRGTSSIVDTQLAGVVMSEALGHLLTLLMCAEYYPPRLFVGFLMEWEAWVVKIAPQDEIQVPFEYTVEWPTDEIINMTEST